MVKLTVEKVDSMFIFNRPQFILFKMSKKLNRKVKIH